MSFYPKDRDLLQPSAILEEGLAGSTRGQRLSPKQWQRQRSYGKESKTEQVAMMHFAGQCLAVLEYGNDGSDTEGF